MTDDLVSKAQAALQATEIPFDQIARRAGVSVRWIYLLKAGQLNNPSIRRLQRVLDAVAEGLEDAA